MSPARSPPSLDRPVSPARSPRYGVRGRNGRSLPSLDRPPSLGRSPRYGVRGRTLPSLGRPPSPGRSPRYGVRGRNGLSPPSLGRPVSPGRSPRYGVRGRNGRSLLSLDRPVSPGRSPRSGADDRGDRRSSWPRRGSRSGRAPRNGASAGVRRISPARDGFGVTMTTALSLSGPGFATLCSRPGGISTASRAPTDSTLLPRVTLAQPSSTRISWSEAPNSWRASSWSGSRQIRSQTRRGRSSRLRWIGRSPRNRLRAPTLRTSTPF